MEYIVIPEDVYLCEIKDLEEVEQQKYKAPQGEMEEAIRVKFTILDGEFKDQTLIKTVKPVIGEGFEGGSPSNLYILLKSVLGNDFEPTLETVNSIIGRQVKVIVKIKTSQKGKDYNIIDNFMAVRPVRTTPITEEEIPVIEPEDKPDIPF